MVVKEESQKIQDLDQDLGGDLARRAQTGCQHISRSSDRKAGHFQPYSLRLICDAEPHARDVGGTQSFYIWGNTTISSRHCPPAAIKVHPHFFREEGESCSLSVTCVHLSPTVSFKRWDGTDYIAELCISLSISVEDLEKSLIVASQYLSPRAACVGDLRLCL